jgi:hypothetical protein
MVRAGKLSLRTARAGIRNDWRAAYRKYVGAKPMAAPRGVEEVQSRYSRESPTRRRPPSVAYRKANCRNGVGGAKNTGTPKNFQLVDKACDDPCRRTGREARLVNPNELLGQWPMFLVGDGHKGNRGSTGTPISGATTP